jgi:prepilin-type processing-associated H-X9-DG protein
VGWLDWTTSPDNTNINYLRERRYARLTDYILTDRNVHKCPADLYESSAQRDRGMRRVRSIAMNGTIGDGNAQVGPWDPLYRQARTLADIRLPSPAETSVLLDEHPGSINDPFLFPPRQSGWVDVPGSLHSGAGTVSFADGHVELHAWKSPGLRTLPVQIFSWGPPAPSGDLDITFMSFSSQRSRDEVY